MTDRSNKESKNESRKQRTARLHTKFLTRLSNDKLMKLAILMQLKYCRSLLLSKTIVTYRNTDRAILQ